jgi:hypothetical protein
MRSLFAGILALTLLDAVVSSQESAQRFGGIFTSLANILNWVMDPTVPAIPDLSGGSSNSKSDYTDPGSTGLIPPPGTVNPAPKPT